MQVMYIQHKEGGCQLYFVHKIMHDSPSYSSPSLLLIACKKLFASHRVTDPKKLMAFFYLLQVKMRFGEMGNDFIALFTYFCQNAMDCEHHWRGA